MFMHSHTLHVHKHIQSRPTDRQTDRQTDQWTHLAGEGYQVSHPGWWWEQRCGWSGRKERGCLSLLNHLLIHIFSVCGEERKERRTSWSHIVGTVTESRRKEEERKRGMGQPCFQALLACDQKFSVLQVMESWHFLSLILKPFWMKILF